MTDGDATDALEQALALYYTPGRATQLRKRRLPADVVTLIKIVAGDEESVSNAARRSSEPSATVVDAARLYLQRVLFDESSDSYRMLGVRPDASDEAIKLHYRWLMRWLHPDRLPERWEVAFADRINRAWNCLNTPERRLRYDEQALKPTDAPSANVAPVRTFSTGKTRRERPELPPVLSSRAIRWLPVAVISALAVACVSILSALYWVQRDDDQLDTTQADRTESAGRLPVRASPARMERSRVVPRRSGVVQAVALARQVPISVASPAVAPDEGTSVIATVRQAVEHPVGPATLPTGQGSAFSNSSGSPVRIAVGPPQVQPGSKPSIATKYSGGKSPALVARTTAIPGRSLPPQSGRQQSSGSVGESRAVSPSQSNGSEASIALSPAPDVQVARTEVAASNAMKASKESENAAMSPVQGASYVTRSFESAYDNGDMEQFLRLFAPNAVNDRGGMDAIVDDYTRFFRDSRQRTLRLEHVSWQFKADRIVGIGSFEARFVGVAEPVTHDVRGWMRIEAVPIDGSWKIQRLQHGNTE